MMACTLDTFVNAVCADWMTPLKSSSKRKIVARLYKRLSKIAAQVEPHLPPTVDSFKERGPNKLSSDKSGSTLAKSDSKITRSASSTHVVATAPISSVGFMTRSGGREA
jgi:hypothetical protein